MGRQCVANVDELESADPHADGSLFRSCRIPPHPEYARLWQDAPSAYSFLPDRIPPLMTTLGLCSCKERVCWGPSMSSQLTSHDHRELDHDSCQIPVDHACAPYRLILCVGL